MAHNHHGLDFAFERVIAPLSKLCGCDFIQSLRWNWMSYTYMFMIYASIFCIVHTMVTRDISMALQSAVMLGIAIQGVVKFSTMSSNLAKFHSLYKYLQRVYEENAHRQGVRREMLTEFDRMVKIVAIVFMLVYGTTIVVFMLLPVFFLVMNGEKMLTLAIMVPYVNETTDTGYLATVIVHNIMLIGSAIGMLATDLTMVLFILHLVPMVQLLTIQCSELNAALAKNEQVRSSQKLHLFMENIIGLQTSINQYIKVLCRLNSYVFYVDINGSAISMICCVYCILVEHLISFYPLFFGLLFKLFVYCLVGTVVEVMANRVCSSITNITWYLLPIRKQRDMIFMIAMSQRNVILFAGTVPVNLDTFVNVLKDIYTCGMLIVEAI